MFRCAASGTEGGYIVTRLKSGAEYHLHANRCSASEQNYQGLIY